MAEEADKAKDAMLDFVREVEREKSGERAAVRSTPKRYDLIQQSFTASPMTRIKSSAPLGRRAAASGPAELAEEAATAGAFNTLYDDAGDTKLQGGSISAGEGGATLADFVVLEAGVLPSGISDGDVLWIDITVSAIMDDDNEIIIAGLDVTSAAYDDGATVDASSFPTTVASGHLMIEIGRWGDDIFRPAGAGNFNVGACPGNWLITRI